MRTSKTISSSIVAVLVTVMALVSCNKIGKGDVYLVKKTHLDFDKSVTVGQAFDGYQYFGTKNWRSYKTEHSRRIVEFTGVLDLTKPESRRIVIIAEKNIGKKTVKGASLIFRFIISKDNVCSVLSFATVATLNNGSYYYSSNYSNPERYAKLIYKNDLYISMTSALRHATPETKHGKGI